MSTIDMFKPNLYDGKLLSSYVLRQRFLELVLRDLESGQQNLFSDPGYFYEAVAVIAGAGNDQITINAAGGLMRGVDGIGGTFVIPQGDSRLTNVKTANAAAETYHVALQRAYYPAPPSGQALLETNATTKKPAYRFYRETFGRMGHPGTVEIQGDDTIKLFLDNMIPGGGGDAEEALTGRSVKVWLANPQSLDAAVAVQTLTVQTAGGLYYVQTPDGASEAFGWTAPTETARDYWVCIEGPLVCKETTRDLRAVVALTGTVTTSIDSSDGSGILTGTGTAFDTEIAVGDVVVGPDGAWILITDRTSATAARFATALETQWTAAAATVKGYAFLGTFTGTGAGSPIVAFSMADQNIIAFNLSEIDQVLRRDSHGYVKVEVVADASDSDEPQVSVKNSAGTRVWSVDEDGGMLFVSAFGAAQTTPIIDMVRTGALGAGNGRASAQGTARGYAGDAAGTSEDDFLAAFLANLAATAGSKSKYGYAADKGSAFTAAFAALRNNIPALSQIKAGGIDLIHLLKLNASDECEVGSGAPLVTEYAGSAAWVHVRTWRTGADDVLRLYVTPPGATVLEMCLVLNGAWDQSMTDLGADAGWDATDTAKNMMRLRMSTAAAPTMNCRIEGLAAAGGPYLEAAWSELFKVTHASLVSSLYASFTTYVQSAAFQYIAATSVTKRIDASLAQSNTVAGVPDWDWSSAGQYWTNTAGVAQMTLALNPFMPAGATLKAIRLYGVRGSTGGAVTCQLKRKTMATGAYAVANVGGTFAVAAGAATQVADSGAITVTLAANEQLVLYVLGADGTAGTGDKVHAIEIDYTITALE